MLGPILSLLAAFFWAGSVILFKKSGEVFSPISLNIYKSCVALILISVTMLVKGIPFFPDFPLSDWLLLCLSGFLGVTLADMFFFMALNRIGASLFAIVECLYLPSVILISYVMLGEDLSGGSILGGFLVLAAVVVGSIRRNKTTNEILKKKTSISGVLIGCLSAVFLAIGIVIIKELLGRADVFWATFVRVMAGTVSLLIFVLCHPKRKEYFSELKLSKNWLLALPASVSGNYLALLCWIAGMKYTAVSRAAILNQMSTIFIFILAAIFLKERITANKIMAIILAITGAYLAILN